MSLLGVSAPSFVWAVILMLLFAFFLPLFPIAGRIADSYAIAGHRLSPDRYAARRLTIRAFGNAAWHHGSAGLRAGPFRHRPGG